MPDDYEMIINPLPNYLSDSKSLKEISKYY